MFLIFVGDKPSEKNISPYIPFVGTQSYKNLLNWIWKMDIDISKVILRNQNSVTIPGYVTHPIFIALGNNASKKLTQLKYKHFKLPHPSPKNRTLNDKKFVDDKLNECKEWLNANRG